MLIQGERITDVGPEAQIKIPPGAQVIDLGTATVLPGLIDAHTHMFNVRRPGMSREASTLIAVQNMQNDLRAGFTTARDMSTHGNGYGDVDIRNAINEGRLEGPRYQVSGRGIVWGGMALAGAAPPNPLTSTVVHSVDEARAAVREHIQHGADWIKLFPAGGYSFTPNGEDQYEVTYPMPVLQALIDETHRLGHKAGCHVYGGEGQKNAIVAGCDTIEHGFGLDQEQVNMMVQKGLYYDPTIVRYTEPYMDDNDAKSTGGKYMIAPIFDQGGRDGGRHHRASSSWWAAASTAPPSRTARKALEFEALVQARRHQPDPRHPIRHHDQCRGARLAGPDRIGRKGQVRRSGRGLGRPAGRHHRAATGQVRDEGRQGHPQRSGTGRGRIVTLEHLMRRPRRGRAERGVFRRCDNARNPEALSYPVMWNRLRRPSDRLGMGATDGVGQRGQPHCARRCLRRRHGDPR